MNYKAIVFQKKIFVIEVRELANLCACAAPTGSRALAPCSFACALVQSAVCDIHDNEVPRAVCVQCIVPVEIYHIYWLAGQ